MGRIYGYLGTRKAALRLATLIVVAIAAAVFVVPAFGWYQYFVRNAVWNAGNNQRSAYNSNLKGVAVSFENLYGGLPQMGSRYINSSGGGLDSWKWSNTGNLIDDRNVAYGAAQCMANSGNNYSVFVDWCYTSNQ